MISNGFHILSRQDKLNQILGLLDKIMGIKTPKEYVEFYINLDMQNSVTLLSFINNEKLVLKHKLENKKNDKESILKGIKILEGLTEEIKKDGEMQVLKKYKE